MPGSAFETSMFQCQHCGRIFQANVGQCPDDGAPVAALANAPGIGTDETLLPPQFANMRPGDEAATFIPSPEPFPGEPTNAVPRLQGHHADPATMPQQRFQPSQGAPIKHQQQTAPTPLSALGGGQQSPQVNARANVGRSVHGLPGAGNVSDATVSASISNEQMLRAAGGVQGGAEFRPPAPGMQSGTEFRPQPGPGGQAFTPPGGGDEKTLPFQDSLLELPTLKRIGIFALAGILILGVLSRVVVWLWLGAPMVFIFTAMAFVPLSGLAADTTWLKARELGEEPSLTRKQNAGVGIGLGLLFAVLCAGIWGATWMRSASVTLSPTGMPSAYFAFAIEDDDPVVAGIACAGLVRDADYRKQVIKAVTRRPALVQTCLTDPTDPNHKQTAREILNSWAPALSRKKNACRRLKYIEQLPVDGAEHIEAGMNCAFRHPLAEARECCAERIVKGFGKGDTLTGLLEEHIEETEEVRGIESMLRDALGLGEGETDTLQTLGWEDPEAKLKLVARTCDLVTKFEDPGGAVKILDDHKNKWCGKAPTPSGAAGWNRVCKRVYSLEESGARKPQDKFCELLWDEHNRNKAGGDDKKKDE